MMNTPARLTALVLLSSFALTAGGCQPADPGGPPTTTASGPSTTRPRATTTVASPTTTAVAGSTTATVGGCPLTPADNYWRARVTSLATHSSSTAWVNTIGRSKRFHMDFGSGEWDGGPIGIPYVTVPSTQRQVPISFDYDDESDPGPYPLPFDAPVEGGPDADGDRHVLVVETGSCTLYEVYDAHRGANATAAWSAGSGAVYDLRSNALRPAGWTSADAAGLPILPGLIRYEEVAAGRIDHAIRFTAPLTQRAYVWPARHFASSSTDPARPPMGAWFRLRADYPTAGLDPQAKVIVEALKLHGMILADNGSSWYLSGAPDPRWNNDSLHQLDAITGADVVAVDQSPLKVSADSGQTR